VLLCTDSSVAQQENLLRITQELGLQHVACRDETRALALLRDHGTFTLMMVAHRLVDGDSFRLIEFVRVSPRHASMPIAFLLAEREEDDARSALLAGATEVFLDSDREALHQFAKGCIEEQGVAFSGKALLVEDSDAEAEYVESLCNDLGMQVDRVRDVDSAIALADANAYVLYLVDIVLEGTRSGVVFVKHLRQVLGVRAPVIVMSGFEDAARRLQALKSGADDFISKPCFPEEFLWRARKILQEHALAENGRRPAASRSQAKGYSLTNLSPREHEICMAILAGTSDKQIALNLGISFWTVRSHIQQIFAKTGALNRRELMSMFIPPSRN